MSIDRWKLWGKIFFFFIKIKKVLMSLKMLESLLNYIIFTCLFKTAKKLIIESQNCLKIFIHFSKTARKLNFIKFL